jgi:SNF2 family DNA or RNA helicase
MSPIAAGMGLNVTAANNVIHFGRHWNPAKEAQATDRAYRIGQEKTVYVYYPITTLSNKYNFASFEQTLDTLLSRKSSLADATLFPTEQTEVRIADFQGLIQDMEQIK